MQYCFFSLGGESLPLAPKVKKQKSVVLFHLVRYPFCFKSSAYTSELRKIVLNAALYHFAFFC